MADRTNARRILDALPPQDLKAAEELAHWHESVAAAEGFKPEERAQLVALIDEAAQPRLRKLAQDYLVAMRAARSSRGQEHLLWTRIHEYWRQAAQAYAGCAQAKPLPQAVAGAVRAAAQQLKWQHLRYGPIDPAVWGLLNRMFALAEARGIAEARPEFLRVALFSAAAPDSRSAPELELADRLSAELAPGFVLAAAAGPQLPYWTDLGRPMAPTRSRQAPQPAPGLRYLGPGTALGRLQVLMRVLESSHEVPAELKLGSSYDAEMVLGVMRHLAMHWAPVPPERRHKRHAVSSQLKIAHGFDGVLEALGGGASDSLNFGAGPADSWTVENVSAGGFGALAPQAKSDWLKVGALVAARADGAPGWLVGTVRRVCKVSTQEIRVGVETLSRAPAVSQFALPSAGQAEGVLLPAPHPGEAAIALRAGIYARGENLEATISGRQHVYMPQGIAERGEDYEIVRFKEMVRES